MVFPPVLLVVALGLVAYYIICPAKGEFHADCTDTIYWAKATFDSGKLISRTFLRLSAALWRQPADAAVSALFRAVHDDPYAGDAALFPAAHGGALLDAPGNALGLSLDLYHSGDLPHDSQRQQKLREIFWGHTIYYSLGILFLFCGLALLFRLQNLVAVHQETRKIRVHSILTFIALILFFVLCCTDQVTAVTIFALPILAGLFLERLLDRKTPLLHWKNTRALLLLLSLGIAVVSGMELGNIWANGVTGAYADAYSNWTAQSTWTEHLQKLPLAWLTLLGLEDIPGEKLDVR